MSKLQELIEKLCPNGVEFKPLGDLCASKSKGTLKITDLKADGDFKVINSGRELYGKYDKYNNDGPTLTIAARGEYAGWLTYFDEKFWAGGLCYPYSSKNENYTSTKFIYYYLKNNEGLIMDSLVARGSIPALNKADIERFPIPVPPIEVQEEIVKILDRFTEYAAELQAELQARKEQYEYYRNLLLTFNPSAGGSGTDDEQEINVTTWGGHSYKIEWRTLGEVCKVLNAPKKLNKKDYCLTGGYPIIDQGQDYIVAYTDDKEALLPSNQYVLFGDHTRNIKFYNGEFAQGADGLKILVSDETILPKFLYYSMKVIKIENRGYNRHWSVVSPLIIPVPPLELQEKIVSILDRFEELTTDLTNGLPAEIAAVKEQYEYYRNKLLTFKKLA